MALIKPIAGKLSDLFEYAVGLRFIDAALNGTRDKPRLLLVHLLLLLLAHGPAQEVGLAQRIACQDLGDLHDLFLIDYDAVGFFQHRLEAGMQHVGSLAAKFAVDIGVDIVHRARPIERDQGGDFLNRARPHLAQRVAHALAFQLEHANSLARSHEVIRRDVI